jgi:hypothetical protein
MAKNSQRWGRPKFIPMGNGVEPQQQGSYENTNDTCQEMLPRQLKATMRCRKQPVVISVSDAPLRQLESVGACIIVDQITSKGFMHTASYREFSLHMHSFRHICFRCLQPSQSRSRVVATLECTPVQLTGNLVQAGVLAWNVTV